MTRLDNMPWEIDSEFSFIREEAECQCFTEEYETDDYVRDIFRTKFGSFYDQLYREDMYIEHYEHELCEGEERPTYAVYIYFNDNAVRVLQEMFPHCWL